MKYQASLLSIMLAITFLLTQCDIPTGLASWEPEILAPLATNTANAKDLTDVKDKVFEFNRPTSDFGFPTGYQIDVPPVSFPTIGPTELNVSDFYESVLVANALFNIELKNSFPIPIASGGKLVFRNDDDTTSSSNIIFEHVISEEISPDETYLFSTTLIDKLINNKVYFYLEQLQSPGGEDVMFSPNGIDMKFEIGFLEIQTVSIRADQEIEISQNVPISLVSESNGPDDEVATGDLDVYVTNELPLNIAIQIYFYGEDGSTIIDSLFEENIIIAGGTTDDATGESMDPAETQLTILLNADKMSNIKKSEKVKLDFGVNTIGYPAGIVSVHRDLNLEFQIVGDLKLNVQL